MISINIGQHHLTHINKHFTRTIKNNHRKLQKHECEILLLVTAASTMLNINLIYTQFGILEDISNKVNYNVLNLCSRLSTNKGSSNRENYC